MNNEPPITHNCPNCGAQLPNGGGYCSRCGAGAPGYNSAKGSRRMPIWAIVLIVLLVLPFICCGGCFAFLYINNAMTSNGQPPAPTQAKP
ncbi:MAG: hypothetical protein JST12_03690 [Armatimonadetes bacterium]|nr:hypothetical protein [Armatimonadota bacterium]MBS1700738.1 hypothetical protein [Armatimonadota bacterium]MBS1728773.1 hypothetical protein [Armatimonadota bacterium]